MKAANGGRLHTLFDYSHQCFLGTGSRRAKQTWSRPPLAPSSGPSQHQQPRAQAPAKGEEPLTYSPRDTQPRGDVVMSGGGHRDGGSSLAGKGPVALGAGGGGVPEAGDRGRGLGRRLPRVLVMHGTSDATVPFSQTAAVAAALRALGVPTVVRFEQGGETNGWYCCGNKLIYSYMSFDSHVSIHARGVMLVFSSSESSMGHQLCCRMCLAPRCCDLRIFVNVCNALSFFCNPAVFLVCKRYITCTQSGNPVL